MLSLNNLSIVVYVKSRSALLAIGKSVCLLLLEQKRKKQETEKRGKISYNEDAILPEYNASYT